MVKNLPANAGDMGSIPDQGTKIPHAAGQLPPPAVTTESVGEPVLHAHTATRRVAPAHGS